VAVQPDQKIVVSGSAPPLAKPNTMATLPTIIRYNANGTLDTSFGNAGFAQVRCPANTKAPGDSYAVILQSDLKIVALAYWAGHLGVFRLNSNGSLDALFNGIGQYYETKPSCAFGLASQWVDSEERIVVSGNRDGIVGVAGAYSKGLLLRFTSAGSLDPGFGDAGVVLTDFTPYNDGYGPVEADAAGRLVVGWAGDDHITHITQYLIVRHASDGSVDAGFGQGGKASPVPPGFTWTNAIQADGSILASGLCDGMSVWRFTDTGLLDATFGGNGWISADFGGAGAQDIVLQSDGKFVVGGGNFIARFWQ
jgi:uncharacterized delta-60 repeat protein